MNLTEVILLYSYKIGVNQRRHSEEVFYEKEKKSVFIWKIPYLKINCSSTAASLEAVKEQNFVCSHGTQITIWK